MKVNCFVCNKEITKPTGEVNRSLNKGRNFYCSKDCSKGIYTNNLGNFLGKGRPENLIADNRKDIFSPFRKHLNRVRARCIKKNRQSDLDLEYLSQIWETQKGVCPLTKVELDNSSLINIYTASLDRINSNEWYVKGNVRFISLMANYAKHNFSDEQLIEFCKRVAKNN